MVRVCQKHLHSPIRSQFGIVKKLNPPGLQTGRGCPGVVHGEGHVVIAGRSFEHFDGETGWAALRMLFNKMHKCCTGLKPGTTKRKCRAGNFRHAQHAHVETPTGINVPHDKCHVIQLFYLYRGWHDHKLLFSS